MHLDDAPANDACGRLGVCENGSAIRLLPAGTNFAPNDIYEFSYTAKDPTVNGIGFAAVRDFNSFLLRYATADSAGTSNPLAGDVTRIYTFAVSQPARMLNDFRNLGFNEDEDGKIVFDGMLQWIAAGDGINLNYRFSQPGRTERNRQDQLYAEGVFPFANQRSTDPITGKTAGRYDKCTNENVSTRHGGLLGERILGESGVSIHHRPARAPRIFPIIRWRATISSPAISTARAVPTVKGNCQQFQNPLDSAPVLRALFVALDNWSTKGVAPPPSEVPRLADGTLVPPLPQSGVGFPKIPGVTYTGLKSTRYLLNYGPKFYSTGIMTINPPAMKPPIFDNRENGPIYPSYVPKTDADGNDLAGIRLPDVTVPLATYTGWSLRSGPQANDGCEAAGQYIPFADQGRARASAIRAFRSRNATHPLAAYSTRSKGRRRPDCETPDASGRQSVERETPGAGGHGHRRHRASERRPQSALTPNSAGVWSSLKGSLESG